MGIRIDQLLSKSPFSMIQQIVTITAAATNLFPELFTAMKNKNLALCQQIALDISQKEGEVDELKRKIRTLVGQSLFFPFPKRDFNDLIISMDSITDRAELLGKIMSLRELTYPEGLEREVNQMITHINSLRQCVCKIFLEELDGLATASFSGPEAEAVVNMIDAVNSKAYDLEQSAHQALVVIFSEESTLDPREIILWNRMIDKLEAVGLAYERTTNTLRRLMEK